MLITCLLIILVALSLCCCLLYSNIKMSFPIFDYLSLGLSPLLTRRTESPMVLRIAPATAPATAPITAPTTAPTPASTTVITGDYEPATNTLAQCVDEPDKVYLFASPSGKCYYLSTPDSQTNHGIHLIYDYNNKPIQINVSTDLTSAAVVPAYATGSTYYLMVQSDSVFVFGNNGGSPPNIAIKTVQKGDPIPNKSIADDNTGAQQNQPYVFRFKGDPIYTGNGHLNNTIDGQEISAELTKETLGISL
jgi:hypothetical protein